MKTGGLDTTWDNVHINDVFKIIGKSCDEGRECKRMKPTELEQIIKNKKTLHRIRKNLEPKRFKNADYGFPLIIVVDDSEYQYVLDGNHRLAVALAAENTGKDAIVKVKELYINEYDDLFGDKNETPT
jgi:hypothetical protein